ncbi:MAG: helix-turn-helix transcriptional regulator [Nitrospira sp.]|nr:helix-turn-helix transcriptional regulator [Nitrospira sp.]
MLKTLRLRKKLTQTELAKRARTSQPYIARLERGEKTNPSLTVLRRLAKALGVTTGAVIDALASRTRGGPR